MFDKKTSIRDVAKRANVSTATVSNVFSGRKPVNGDLKIRVQKAATELGYQVNRAASFLRSGRARVVAVLVPDLTDTFFSTIVSELETLAFGQGYDVIVASSHDNPDIEASRLNALMAWEPAGLIVIPCSGNIPEDLLELKAGVPLVLVDRVASKDAVADTVTIDNYHAGKMAAKHLLDEGHRDIILAVSDLSFPPIKERADGAKEEIDNLAGAVVQILELGSNMNQGAATFTRWLDKRGSPSAVIALTNVTSLSVLSALAQGKIDIPTKTSFVAFDDYAWMSARNTGLTAIRQPVQEMAAAAWSRLLLRMDGNKNVQIKASVLSAELVERASVKAVKSATVSE